MVRMSACVFAKNLGETTDQHYLSATAICQTLGTYIFDRFKR